MAELDKALREISARVQDARIRLMREQPFYASLLMQMRFAVDMSCQTMYTDSKVIGFSPSFADSLNASELEFVLMHEVLHAALGHCTMEQSEYDHEIFNIACDIVVNSNILYSRNMILSAINLRGEPAMHLTPKGEEGYLYTVDEVYAMLIKKGKASKPQSGSTGGRRSQQEDKTCEGREDGGFDEHTRWSPDREEEARWLDRMVNATELAECCGALYASLGGASAVGKTPLGVTRRLGELTKPQLDWRTLLADFIQEDINDYTLSPPDRRFDGGDFFLPSYDAAEECVRNVVFLVDTSGSVSDEMIRDAYSEIRGAIEQFDGRLEGYLAFGDTEVYDILPFDGDTDLTKQMPRGGGGTDFEKPIRHVLDRLGGEARPSCMIYITDGFCSFPEEAVAEGIPFLWLLTASCPPPPWGRAVWCCGKRAP